MDHGISETGDQTLVGTQCPSSFISPLNWFHFPPTLILIHLRHSRRKRSQPVAVLASLLSDTQAAWCLSSPYRALRLLTSSQSFAVNPNMVLVTRSLLSAAQMFLLMQLLQLCYHPSDTQEDFRASKNLPSPKEAVLQGQNRLLSPQLSPLTLSRSAAPPHLVKAALTSAQCLFPLSTRQ